MDERVLPNDDEKKEEIPTTPGTTGAFFAW